MSSKGPVGVFFLFLVLSVFSAASVDVKYPSVKPHKLSELEQTCQDCHQGDLGDPTPRKLTMEHQSISGKFNHGNGQMWCFDCHNPERDHKIAVSGNFAADFKYPSGVCAKCHPSIYKDWEKGIHSKIIGTMTGDKTKLACIECHNPHHPKFKSLIPVKRPEPREQKLYVHSKAGGH